MYRDKKGFSEITSFVLLLLLVTVASIGAYVFSKDVIDDKVAEIDLKNSDAFLKKIYFGTSEIENFDGSSFSLDVHFQKGKMNFESNQVAYYSFIPYVGSDYCINEICYSNNGGYEVRSVNLSGTYVFESNFSLGPGSYSLIFKNDKSNSKIEVVFK